MNNKKYIALIPARGGSKGISKKNLLPICGRPLIAWTIEAAKKCPYIKDVMVSSDDDEILSVAESFGAISIKRPAELATDTVSPTLTLKHALTAYKEKTGILPEYVAYLQPTSALRTAKHITEAFDLLNKDKKADAVISVYEIDNRLLKSSILTPDGYLTPASKDEFVNMDRQMLPKLYKQNGAIYILRCEESISNPNFKGRQTLPFVMTKGDSADLDSLDDVPVIETCLRKRNN